MTDSPYATLLWSYTVYELKDFVTILGEFFPELPAPKGGIKQNIIHFLSETLLSPKNLYRFYSRLSPLDQSALQETVHTTHGEFNSHLLLEKYGNAPSFNRYSWSYSSERRSPIALLFSQDRTLPDDLLTLLKAIIPPPPKKELKTYDDLPETIPTSYRSMGSLPLTIHETEVAALSDLISLLKLCEEGVITVSESTGRVSLTGARRIQKALFAGDFYPAEGETSQQDQAPIGPLGIRPFAWSMMLQVAGVAKEVKGRLLLSPLGKKVIELPNIQGIRLLWNSWIEGSSFHELSRVELMKGQRSRETFLRSPHWAREQLVQALSQLPLDKWISIDDFFKFVVESGYYFNIIENSWSLHLFEADGESLSDASWAVINGRFTLAFLLEYAASLGVIDVGLTQPWGASSDLFSKFWRIDDYGCLSRYDGLKYIRVNQLGGWLLGLTEEYRSKPFQRKSQFQLLPTLELTLLSEKISPADQVLMDRLCEKSSDRVWRLSKEKMIRLLEEGGTVDTIREELARLSPQAPLPDSLLDLLKDIGKERNQLSIQGICILIECADEESATLLSHDRALKRFTFLVGERHLIVLNGHESEFCKIARRLGFIVPTGIKKLSKACR